mmetsp:Transcript_14287/g.18020  ORF Transcript_14287/g.18020 Transcript_14287/m.18020 type:complete len:208 (+) Transcript_14287:94-717(+)|eukprot:CAMPEP_0172501880 /NCGR_PEP_ID=MMETSP1066-20121228/154734_1 /TAXON_ID=671091 /ORGANISM="Coscinodiscus wailesii, Strain CCMP2513" /LENGTH=207 /DNA_ID=CAMNT_0013276921 /DNA_START=90 /DNA_END=713 /DNA_ORIENTATION=+
MNDNDASEPLVEHPKKHRPSKLMLYEVDSTLEIGSSIAMGFLVLLTSGKEGRYNPDAAKHKKSSCCAGGTLPDTSEHTTEGNEVEKASAEELSLAFASLTDGNMIDACFGINPMGGSRYDDASKYATQSSKTAKETLRNAADGNDDVKRLAVEAYVKCFRTVVDYNDEIVSLNFVSFCFKSQKLREDAEKKLIDSFEDLYDALRSNA